MQFLAIIGGMYLTIKLCLLLARYISRENGFDTDLFKEEFATAGQITNVMALTLMLLPIPNKWLVKNNVHNRRKE